MQENKAHRWGKNSRLATGGDDGCVRRFQSRFGARELAVAGRGKMGPSGVRGFGFPGGNSPCAGIGRANQRPGIAKLRVAVLLLLLRFRRDIQV